MLREDGFVLDDGTTARLAEDHYFMTTTTANAGKVMQHLEFCQQWLWPELDVQMVSVTEQWAQFAVAGPRARDVLRGVVDPGARHLQRGLPLPGRRRRDRLRRHAGAALPHLLLRRARLRDRAFRRGYGDALVRGDDGGRARRTASRPTAPRRSA